MTDTFYVTTPIYYVNDVPHIGHAYTTIAADVLTRYHRARGRETYFLTGVDEHGQKVEQAARKRGISPKAHCDEMVGPFKELWERLNIDYSYFIRTTNEDHKAVVQKAMQQLYDAGLIEKRTYEGWYSTSSERFWMEKDLVDGKDPDSGLPVEWLSESNYFFLMSKYKQQLLDYMKKNPEFIRPQSRFNEIIGFLQRDLEDLCISRPKSRLAWGIELPFDPDYVTYVWFDALLNYISALGYQKDDESLMRFWPAQFQLIGKDILTTHSVYWITMLFALGVSPPEHIFAHGWWTVEGRKMSKSLHNVIDPNVLIDAYGADAVRFFLMREIPFGQDGDFSHAAFINRINAELANDLGNALNRSTALTQKNFDGLVPQPDEEETDDDRELKKIGLGILGDIREHLGDRTSDTEKSVNGNVHFSLALDKIWLFIRAINKYIDTQAPWTLAKNNDLKRLQTVLYNCLEALRFAGVLIQPFMPVKAKELFEILGYADEALSAGDFGTSLASFDTIKTWGQLPPNQKLIHGQILFPRIEPEHVENILRNILQLASSKEEAIEEFSAIFPKFKPKQADKWVTSLVGDTFETRTSGKQQEKEKGEKSPFEPAAEVTFDDVMKLDLRIAEILEAENVPKSDKLIKLMVDIGSEKRQLVAGIGKAWKAQDLIGKKVIIVANLKAAKLMGVKSQGMILAAAENDTVIHIPELDPQTPNGTRVR